MTDSALSILQREGEKRGAAGHVPDREDFDEHVRFYRSATRITRTLLAFVALFLLGLYYLLAR